jgi:hypothetical protein
MKITYGLLAAAGTTLALAACDTGAPAQTPQPETLGAAGPGYCENAPLDSVDQQRWEELCLPNR